MEEALQNKLEKNEKIENTVETSIVEHGHILNDWFIFREERHFGPMSTKQVRYLLSKKMIASSHFIWRPGFTGWTAIGQVESFRSYGRDEIDNLTDDDFSKRAMLGGIDRIGWEKNEIDFIDKKNSNAYELEQVRMTRAYRNVLSEPLFMEKLNNFFGLFGSDFRYGQALVGFLAVAFLFAGIVTANRVDTSSTLAGFSTAIQERLTTISEKTETIRNPSFAMFEKASASGDPILVSATNLPLGTRVLIDVIGKPDTLMGAYRFNQKFEMNIDSKIFSTDPIREASGKFIPAGTYTVFAKCLSCGEADRNLFAKEFTFGMKDRDAYTAGLAKFHEETRQNARLELMELGDLSGNLNQQFAITSQRFARAVTGRDVSRWERFQLVGC